jgi:uncharacterized DUF497 family protein
MGSLDMRIEGVIWLRKIVDKLASKHNVGVHEVEETLRNQARIFFLEKGERAGEDVYMALGRTDAGRYLAVLFIHKAAEEVLILSARDMAPKERKRYGKK